VSATNCFLAIRNRKRKSIQPVSTTENSQIRPETVEITIVDRRPEQTDDDNFSCYDTRRVPTRPYVRFNAAATKLSVHITNNNDEID
jgi:hypothetical protein